MPTVGDGHTAYDYKGYRIYLIRGEDYTSYTVFRICDDYEVDSGYLYVSMPKTLKDIKASIDDFDYDCISEDDDYE